MSTTHRAIEEPVKTPYEEVIFPFNFTKALLDGETILGSPIPDVTVTPPGEVEVESIAVLTPRVQVKLSGGADGGEYEVNCKIETNLQKLELQGGLKVRAP